MKVVARIKGGLGNQLFGYAAARRLALANGAELVIDHVTGFARDDRYGRRYALDPFRISARKATPAERLEPLERYRRAFLRWRMRRRPFEARSYLEQETEGFDRRLVQLRLRRSVHVDGVWASERYFEDHAATIREDLTMVPPAHPASGDLVGQIRRQPAIAVHVRFFGQTEATAGYNLPAEYFRQAVALMEKRHAGGHYFVFSDDPARALRQLALPPDRVTLVSGPDSADNCCADLSLMAQCRHFIMANSTFSWWGAWLGQAADKTVIAPMLQPERPMVPSWNFLIEIPSAWIVLDPGA